VECEKLANEVINLPTAEEVLKKADWFFEKKIPKKLALN
jgi:hypothetical protein